MTPVKPQDAEQDPQPLQEVQTGHPFSQVHSPTLVEDPGHPVANWFVPGMTHRLFLLLWEPDAQVAEQDPQPPQEVQIGHPSNQVHLPTLVQDPGHPVANWFVPAITHRLFLLLWVSDPQVAEQDPQPPQEVQTGHPFSQVHLPTLVEDPGQPIANWFVP